MAIRRMLSKDVLRSTDYLVLPHSAQSLYVQLNLDADDEGYCDYGEAFLITRASSRDLEVLQKKEFIHVFDYKVLLILHWSGKTGHNKIQKDRFKESELKPKYPYSEDEVKREVVDIVSELDTNCIQNVSVGKVREGKESKGNKEKKQAKKDGGVEVTKKKKKSLRREGVPYEKIIDDLNKKTGGRKFTVTDDIIKMINKRYDEGRKEADFYQVNSAVAYKWNDQPDKKDNQIPTTAYNGNFGTRLLWQTASTQVSANSTDLKRKNKFTDFAPATMVLCGKVVKKDWLVEHYKSLNKEQKKKLISDIKDWKGLTQDDRDRKILEVRGKIPEKIKEIIGAIGGG